MNQRWLRSWLRFFQGVAVVICASLPAWAEPPEVTGLLFDSADTILWDGLAGTDGYHLYRSTRADLPFGNFGDCLQGSIRGTSADVPADPPPGVAYTYLVSAFDETGEGSVGNPTTPRTVSTACIPARRCFDLTPSGDPGDGVEDGLEPRRNASAMLWSPDTGTVPTGMLLPAVQHPKIRRSADQDQDTSTRHRGFYIIDRSYPRSGGVDFSWLGSAPTGSSSSGVYLHTGEFFLHATDVAIRTRGHVFTIRRHYRSQIHYDGPMGLGWESTLNARLAPLGNDVLFHDGTGRRERFFREDTTHFTSPTGLYSVLRENLDDSFSLRHPNGTILDFHAFDGSNLEGALESIEDRNGNVITFLYDHQGLLTTVTDTMGRATQLTYDADGRVESVTDFFNRTWTYTYDAAGNLTSATSPSVTGTPNGNDFPAGKTTTYTYDPAHNLLNVIRPNEHPAGTPTTQNTYGTVIGQFDFDRVISQTIGGTNTTGVPAGGTLTYDYTSLNPAADPADLTIPRRQTIVTDRNGNLEEFTLNHPGNCLSHVERTNREVRPGEPDYTTDYVFNADGEIAEITRPEGNRTLYTYDTSGADRFRAGNVVEARRVADTIASGGRGDGHGAEANDLVWAYTYEPVFNRQVAMVEPRGNDPTYVPQNGGPGSPDRYKTEWFYDYEEGDPSANGIDALASRFEIDTATARSNLGDLNGDTRTDQASGNLVRKEAPTVQLDPTSNQAAIETDISQEIVSLYEWNDLGQMTALVDAEENRSELEYYAETDPDGDGTPTTAPPDGRTLDTVAGGYVKTRLRDTASASGRDNGTDPTPAAIRVDFEYDPVGNVTGLVDGRGVLTRRVVNELDQLVELRHGAATSDASGPDGDPATGRGETGLAAFSFKSRFEYDANDNVVREQIEDRDLSRGVGTWVDTTASYDLLDNRVEHQQEATSSLNLVTQYRYDANESLDRIVEPEGNETTSIYDERDLLFLRTRGATGPRGGTPSTRTYDYDGNGNLIRVNDAQGNPIDYEFDGFDRRTRTIDQVGNTVDRFWDPARNLVRTLVRGPVGGPTPPDRLGLMNVDLAETEYLYDELGRLFREDRRLFVPVGASLGRPALLEEGPLLLGDGFVNRIVEYDRLSRLTFLVEDTESTIRSDYDGLGRVIRTTLPDGSVVQGTYDTNHNLVETFETEVSSSTGPPDEQFFTTYFFDSLDRATTVVDNVGQTRRYVYDSLDAVVTETDPDGPAGGTINRRTPGHTGTSVQINDHGNVTANTYDGRDRLVTVRRILTAGGNGDGSTSPPADPTQSGDGLITMSLAWDRNSLVTHMDDDNGNRTAFTYDNLNRKVRVTNDDDTRMDYVYDGEHNVTQVTDPNGTVSIHAHDPANRLTRIDAIPATGIDGTSVQTFEYDGRHLMTRATDDNNPTATTDDAVVEIVLDSLGRTIEEKQTLGTGAVATALVDVGWRAENLITRLTYPDGRQINYGYDTEERLDTVADSVRTESAGFDYFGLGRLHTRTYSNNVRMTMLSNDGSSDIGFDGVKRTVEMRHLNSSNALVAGFEHTYDGASNRLSELRPHHPNGPLDAQGELYDLDSANRLVDFQEGVLDGLLQLVGAPSDQQQWTLDGVGNWDEFARNGTDFCQDVNNLNEYDEDQSGDNRFDDGAPDDFAQLCAFPIPNGRNHGHDKNGNLTDQGEFGIVYDFMNRAVRVTRNSDSATVAEYKWDALGRRVHRVVTNSGDLDVTRRYLYTPAPVRNSGPGRDYTPRAAEAIASAGGEPVPLVCKCFSVPYPCGPNKTCYEWVCVGECGGGGGDGDFHGSIIPKLELMAVPKGKKILEN